MPRHTVQPTRLSPDTLSYRERAELWARVQVLEEQIEECRRILGEVMERIEGHLAACSECATPLEALDHLSAIRQAREAGE